ncbi:hypothetical protein ABT330_35615 [Streptomyces sp. NPDC000658]|uniref:hypothetical protein n=1 Tax=Streptomyces sp. NPDC000658 TaxID=3154266 RepID=UPI00331AA4FD
MPTTRSPAAAAALTLARIVKALLAALVLAAAVAGLPLLLTWATPVIWASTHDDLTHLLDRQDTGAAFLLLLVAVGWIGWAQFSFCALCELAAQLRGRAWHAPRGLGASQRAAALLIGSILVLLPTSSALASDAQASPATTAPSIPGRAPASPGAGADQDAPSSTASTPTSHTSYTVREMRPAESLWGIAEQELGDGERWREIASLNEGRLMSDGEVFHANSFLQPGWQLRMPEATAMADDVRTQLGHAPTASAGNSEHAVTARSGDYLSKIAQEELGDGDKWPELFNASQGKPQPHGLPQITDPDVIYAGQQITVPGAQPDQQAPPREAGDSDEADGQQSTPPAAQAPDGKQNPGGDTSDGKAPAPRSSPPRAPSSHAVEQPGLEHSPSTTHSATPPPRAGAPSAAASPSGSDEPSGAAAPSLPATPPQTPVPAPADDPLALRTVLGAGALLAAAITGALALRRTLQRRRRKPGEKIAMAPEPSPAEAKLAATAEPGGAARLDMVLKALARQAAQQQDGASLPPLRAARIGAHTVEVLPEDLVQEPQAPFVSGTGGWWLWDRDAAVLDEEAAREVPAPYPALVTIGSTQAGDLLLLNLARMSALMLDGNPVHITEVCTSLALELGMSPWASEVEVVTVGFGEDLVQLLPTARIAHMRQPTHALRDLSERLLEAHQLPETRHQPYVLLCASTLDPDTAWQFAEVIDKAGTVPVTLIAPASTAAVHFPHAEILNASLSTPQQLDCVGAEITVQRLEHAAYLQITTALKVSAQPPHPAEGPWQDVPDEPHTVPRPEQPQPPEPCAPATNADPSPRPLPAADVSRDVFPALLAATTDPSGLRVLPAVVPAPHGDDNPAPVSETAVAPVAEESTPTKTPSERPAQDAAAPQTQARVDEGTTQDPHAPQIRVLGPVEVSGVDHTGHGPRMAQLAALLFFRPGRSADAICYDMDPISPWGLSTLNARMQGLRRSLGSDPAGNPYVPRRKSGDDPYRLSPGVRCDWTGFLQLAEKALPLGPAGLPDLEQALTLVRGKPFGGTPPPWAEPYQQEMITRIIDVAHTVATYRTPAGPHHDLSAARRAVATGLDVDDTAELLYRAWLRIESAAGNRHGLHTAITRIQQINQSLDCSLEAETEQLINELLNASSASRPGGIGPC